MSAAIQSLTLSPRQAAAFLGIGKTKLIALIHAGRIKAKSLDGRIRVSPTRLPRFTRAGRTTRRRSRKKSSRHRVAAVASCVTETLPLEREANLISIAACVRPSRPCRASRCKYDRGDHLTAAGNQALQSTRLRGARSTRAMVRFIGADGSEQLPIRFLLRRTSVDEPPYIVDVTRETEFDEWPNMSRK